nr:MFS transporter [Nitratireductor luteus]
MGARGCGAGSARCQRFRNARHRIGARYRVLRDRSVIGTQTFVQLRAPDSMRGRTLSVHGLISRGSPALGALGTGWAFDHVGLTLPVLFATGLVLIAVIAGIPAMRALGNPEPGDR